MQIPDAAVGAVTAALIAGIISLLGLIISKEQKTSEFRQAWIDALRADLTAYLTQVNAINDATKVRYVDHAKKVEALRPLYIPLSYYSLDKDSRNKRYWQEPSERSFLQVASLR